MLQYKVSISYHHFIFDDLEEALGFAKMAKLHYKDREDNDYIDVTIELQVVDTVSNDNTEKYKEEE